MNEWMDEFINSSNNKNLHKKELLLKERTVRKTDTLYHPCKHDVNKRSSGDEIPERDRALLLQKHSLRLSPPSISRLLMSLRANIVNLNADLCICSFWSI